MRHICEQVFATPSLLAFFALAEATSSLIKWTSKLEQEKTRTKKQSAYLSKCYLYFMVLHIITGNHRNSSLINSI